MNSDLHKLGRAGGLAVLGYLMPGLLWALDSNTERKCDLRETWSLPQASPFPHDYQAVAELSMWPPG